MSDGLVVVIGAGPAGLTAAYLLAKEGRKVLVLEADHEYVGGISRTVNYKGFLCDIGGHRFFSKSIDVENLWTELLPNDMLDRPRSSRIYYRGQFFAYPLRAFEALFKLGIFESIRCVCSYGLARIFPARDPKSFEDWVSNQFGKRLFNIFFKSYTEKVWGMSCKDISADWAAQRIKGLSLFSAVWNALMPKKPAAQKDGVIKTLIESFRYPRKGPGMLWEECAKKIQALGGRVELGKRVSGLKFNPQDQSWSVTVESANGVSEVRADHVISSAPIRELVAGLSPAVPRDVAESARSLKYRDFLIVMLILKDRNLFGDNWIYIHDPSVLVGRIQNFKSWSPEMIPDSAYCAYGMEYFCNEGDSHWTKNDVDLIAQAKLELEKLGLARADEVLDGTVIRQKKAYPVYDGDYLGHVEKVRLGLEASYPKLHLVGRNGMHKYNNQDHAMMTAMLCAKNILAGKPLYDLWRVNQDAEYHEAGSAGESASVSGLRQVPTPLPSKIKKAG